MDLGVKSMPSTNSSASCSWKSGEVVGVQFPAGLKVLVVDDDPTCLRILEKMLKNCLYEVTTCNRAEGALDFLRDKKDGCDIVISDVHMPDMDGFKLLELVGLEMDLPVIMMSADDSKHVVMKGVTHGACDYLIKPVRIEALKNIWQHVVRKKKQEWKERDLENSGSVEEGERQQKPLEDVDCSSSFNEGNWKNSKKRKDEEDETEDRDDSSTLKKPRVVWSVDLHQQFVAAVNQLGIDKAVPKRILELMNVPGLTRENVASHLQKFRLYLRRLSGVSQHQNGLGNPFMGPSDAPFGPMSSLDLQALAASGQLQPQSFASIQSAALGRATSRSPVEQRNVFNFESPKLRFVQGQQQLVDNSKQVSLLHGIPTNMDSKQLATLHQSALGNMNMHVHSPTNQSNSLLMQISRPQSRTQILNETNGSNSPSSVGQPQAIPSAAFVRNGIDHARGPQYVSISQPSTSADLSSLSTEFSGNISQPPRGIPPNYIVNQNRNQDWRLQDVGSTFMQSQHSNIQVVGLDASTEQQKSGVSAGNEASFSGLGNVGQQLSFSASDSRPLSNNVGGRYGQEDLMSVLLKQVDFAPSEHDKLNYYS